MTLDEVIKYFEEMVEIGETYDVSKIVEENRQLLEWLKDYKWLLEQQSCEDAISRQAVLNLINADWKYEGLEEDVSSLPPVTPQPKTEHWIEERTYMICPNCHDIWHYEENQTERFKFCPTCGKGLNNESKHIRNRVQNNRTN